MPDCHENEDQISLFLLLIIRTFLKSIFSVIVFFYEISKKAFFKSDVNLNPTKKL